MDGFYVSGGPAIPVFLGAAPARPACYDDITFTATASALLRTMCLSI